MKIKLVSTSAKRREVTVELVDTSYIVTVDGVKTAKFSNKLKTEQISERLATKGLKQVEIKRIFDQLANMGKENARQVNVKPSEPDSKKKKQLFSDATVKLVAKEFGTVVATLAQIAKDKRKSVYSSIHQGLGTSIRNFIRTDSKEVAKVTGNPITMDSIWSAVIERAIELKLYSENDVDVYQLAKLTGTKVKELDLVLFKDVESVKKVAGAVLRAFNKTFGSGMTMQARLRQTFRPKNNMPLNKYNWLRVDLPLNMVTSNGNSRINIFLGKGTIFIQEAGPKTSNHITEVNLVKGTNIEIVQAIIKSIKVKTNTVVKPKAVGKFNEASQYVVDTFGKDLMAKGIELIPTKGGINFYHSRRGTVKASFGELKGKLVYKDQFQAAFGEVFPIGKKITKPLIDRLVKPLLK